MNVDARTIRAMCGWCAEGAKVGVAVLMIVTSF